MNMETELLELPQGQIWLHLVANEAAGHWGHQVHHLEEHWAEDSKLDNFDLVVDTIQAADRTEAEAVE